MRARAFMFWVLVEVGWCVPVEEIRSLFLTQVNFWKIIPYDDEGAMAGEGCFLAGLPGNKVVNLQSKLVPVAVPRAMYGNSIACGMCLQIGKNERNSSSETIPTPIYAVVSHECHWCKEQNQLSWNLSGIAEHDVSVQAIPCPVAAGSQGDVTYRVRYMDLSSLQIQVLNARLPTTSLELLFEGQWRRLVRKPNNFFVLNMKGKRKYKPPIAFRITSIAGEELTGWLNNITEDGYVDAKVQYRLLIKDGTSNKDYRADTVYAPKKLRSTTISPRADSEQYDGLKTCFAINAWANDPVMDKWCIANCALRNCPTTHCSCDPNYYNSKTPSPCHAVNAWYGNLVMDKWCVDNCAIGYCPETHCSCKVTFVSTASTKPTSPTMISSTAKQSTDTKTGSSNSSTFTATPTTRTEKTYIRACYYTSWAQYRPGVGKFTPDKIDPFICTHIIYAFVRIADRNDLATFEWNDETMLKEISALKSQNPDLKLLLAVGGWNHENGFLSRFSSMVSSIESRQRFINSAVYFMRNNNIDGLDLDWEYPAHRGNSPPEDKSRFTDLCRELQEAFVAEHNTKSPLKDRLLLTAAVAASPTTVSAAYEPAKLARYLDWINLMTYDLHAYWDGQTGHQTAMVGQDAVDTTTVESSLRYWIASGMPAEKIALGLATYGRTFTLSSPSKAGLKAPVIGAGRSQTYTGEPGYIAYFEVCEMIRQGMTIVRTSESPVKAPYGQLGDQWICYDDAESLKYKVDNLIIANELRGAMFWELTLDDFTGSFCGEGKNPLLQAVKVALQTNSPPRPTMTTVSVSTVSKPGVVPSSTSQTKPSTVAQTAGKGTCFAINAWANDPVMDKWCIANCALRNCPTTHCSCDPNYYNSKTPSPCHAVNAWYGNLLMDKWCVDNCAIGYCPETHCSCEVTSLRPG